ncbi:MAG: pseudouridine synthase [Bacteroidota bacterium]
MLDIVYQDTDLIAINKPHGLLVHPSYIARDVEEFAMQMLRDQIGQYVYPVHRLDRKTAGILLFALNKETDRAMQMQFSNKLVSKKYMAIVRGYAPDELLIDYPLVKENGTLQEAKTHFITLQKAELDIPFGKHATSRYSLIEANPETGRMHQLRRHFAHIFHPIIGDRPHGCNKQNKFWLEKFNMNTMMLHASELGFIHPNRQEPIHIKAGMQQEFKRVSLLLGFTPCKT